MHLHSLEEIQKAMDEINAWANARMKEAKKCDCGSKAFGLFPGVFQTTQGGTQVICHHHETVKMCCMKCGYVREFWVAMIIQELGMCSDIFYSGIAAMRLIAEAEMGANKEKPQETPPPELPGNESIN